MVLHKENPEYPGSQWTECATTFGIEVVRKLRLLISRNFPDSANVLLRHEWAVRLANAAVPVLIILVVRWWGRNLNLGKTRHWQPGSRFPEAVPANDYVPVQARVFAFLFSLKKFPSRRPIEFHDCILPRL